MPVSADQIFAVIGMAGFLGLLILWLWVLPDRPQGAGWWVAIALFFTVAGLTGTIVAQYGLATAAITSVAVGGAITFAFGRPRNSTPPA